MDAGSAAATAGLHVAPRAAPARSAAAGAAPAAATNARSRAEARTERAGLHATAPASQPAAGAAHAGAALSAAAAPVDGRRSASPPGAAAGSASVIVQDARTPCVHACNKHGRKRVCMFHAGWPAGPLCEDCEDCRVCACKLLRSASSPATVRQHLAARVSCHASARRPQVCTVSDGTTCRSRPRLQSHPDQARRLLRGRAEHPRPLSSSRSAPVLAPAPAGTMLGLLLRPSTHVCPCTYC